MPRVIRVALPGYNALIDTNPDHYALYTDGTTDYILIKEKLRDTVSVASGGAGTTIAHQLEYIPLCFVFAEVSAGEWRKLFSFPIDASGVWYEVNSTNLVLRNTTGSAVTFSYYIFYDNLT